MPRFAPALLLLAVTLTAADLRIVYVSPDGDDQAAGDSPDNAWATLAAVQRAIDSGGFAAGGEIRLARGAVFGGSLAINKLVLPADATLVVTAYGDGPAPVIRGFAALTAWEDAGGGRWRTRCESCRSRPATLTRDRSVMPIARWPNPDEADGGYLYYQSASGRTGLTDDALAGPVDWTGGEAVVRSAAWILDRLPITAHKGATLTFGAPASYDIPKGYGYFIQNHPAALDRDGEWVFDPATSSITVLLNGSTPSTHDFAVTSTDTLIAVNGSQGFALSDVRLEGANRANLEIQQSGRIAIRRVESVQSGDVGIRCINCNGLLIEDSLVDQAANHGVDIFNCADCLVQGSRITNTATIAGMGRSGNGQYNGVRFGGTNAVFRRNTVSRTGYLGIDIRGAARIEQNVFTEPNLVKTDGGGIYTWGNKSVEIVGNLVLNGAGSKSGVPWNDPATSGIYIDDQSEDMRVRGNTVVSVGTHGIFLHNTRAITVEGNLIVDAGAAQIAYIHDTLAYNSVTETLIRDNTFVSRLSGSRMARATTSTGPEFFTSIGPMTGNRYCSPFADPVFQTASSSVFLDAWQRTVDTDRDAQLCPQRYAPYRVIEVTGANRVTNGTFDKDISSWFCWPTGSLEAAWDAGRFRMRHTTDAPIIHCDEPVGLIENGQYYRLRFESQSDKPGHVLRAYLRKWDPDYRMLSPAVDLPLDDQKRSWEFVLPGTGNEARSLLIFELANSSQVAWLDNVRLEPVRAQPADRNQLVRVEVNPSADPLILELAEDRTDLQGNPLPAGSRVTVPPFGAVVLFAR